MDVFVYCRTLSMKIAVPGSATVVFFNMALAAFFAQPPCVVLATTDLFVPVCRMGTALVAATNHSIPRILEAALHSMPITVHTSATKAIS